MTKKELKKITERINSDYKLCLFWEERAKETKCRKSKKQYEKWADEARHCYITLELLMNKLGYEIEIG